MRFSHIAWNLGGLIVPLAVAASTVPHLVSKLGQEKFGLLALAWGLIGYASALDLGLGRALTQMVASMRGENKLGDIPHTLVTASRITFATGLFAGVLIALFALLGGASIIHTESTPDVEIQISIFLLAIALPAQAMSATYKGLNEAFMNFKGISLLRAILGVITFAGPYAVSFFSIQLPWLILTLVLSRLLSLFIYKNLAQSCLHLDKAMLNKAAYSTGIAKKLLRFGGWVTMSSIISPFMVQADRFFIAAMLSASAVSVYVLPYEIVVQSLILVGGITSVMFPVLCKKMKEQPTAWHSYFRKWLFYIIFIMGLVCFVLAWILPWVMDLWIGEGLKKESIDVGRILCIGVFFNSIGSVFYSLLHANGRAELTAGAQLIELPIYVIFLMIGLNAYGLQGVAVAWTFRMMIDAIILMMASKKIYNV